MLPVWNGIATSLGMTYVALGVIATVSSLVLATFTSELGTLRVKIVAFGLSASLGLITGFEVGAKANAARTAWRLLNAAILAYENDPTFTIRDLHKQYLAGEELLGLIRYNSPEKPQAPNME